MKKYFAVLALCAAVLPVVHAQIMVVAPGPNPASSSANLYSGTVGERFTVNSGFTVTVTGLGFWDYTPNGVSGSDVVSVGIFDGLGNILTEVDTNSGGQSGGAPTSSSSFMGSTYTPNHNPGSGQFFVYTLTTPVTLSAGTFTIAGWGYNNVANYYINGGSGNDVANFDLLSGALTLNGSAFTSSDLPATLPDSVSPGASIMSATFVASAIPEPSTYAIIFGTLVLGVAGLRRLHQRKVVA